MISLNQSEEGEYMTCFKVIVCIYESIT